MTEEKFLAYVTKYALTKGILKVEARKALVSEEVYGARLTENHLESLYRIGEEIFLDLEEAKKNAEERRIKKIKSLKKQIKKMENLKISVK